MDRFAKQLGPGMTTVGASTVVEFASPAIVATVAGGPTDDEHPDEREDWHRPSGYLQGLATCDEIRTGEKPAKPTPPDVLVPNCSLLGPHEIGHHFVRLGWS